MPLLMIESGFLSLLWTASFSIRLGTGTTSWLYFASSRLSSDSDARVCQIPNWTNCEEPGSELLVQIAIRLDSVLIE